MEFFEAIFTIVFSTLAASIVIFMFILIIMGNDK